MDAESFKRYVEIAREYKVGGFEVDGMKVSFHPTAFLTEPPKSDPDNKIDPDEAMLIHIEELKAKAMAGIPT